MLPPLCCGANEISSGGGELEDGVDGEGEPGSGGEFILANEDIFPRSVTLVNAQGCEDGRVHLGRRRHSFCASAHHTDENLDEQELAALIRSGKVPRKDYLIVDVRDDDWEGGNIKGSFNSPAHMFAAGVDGLVRDTEHVPLLVFHCTLSQVR